MILIAAVVFTSINIDNSIGAGRPPLSPWREEGGTLLSFGSKGKGGLPPLLAREGGGGSILLPSLPRGRGGILLALA